jgi:hypothetical protein
LRQIVVFLVLIVILAGLFQLSRLAKNWHYIVPAEPGELLYAESFDDSGKDWTLYDSNTGNIAQVNGSVMSLYIGTEQAVFWSEASPYFADFDVTVETRPVESPVESVYGVLFRERDASNFYAFFISTDGYYKLIRVVDNVERTLSNWHTTDSIYTGAGVVNQIRVVGVDDLFQFYVNGDVIELCIPDHPANESTPLENGECLGGTWRITLVDDSLPSGHLAVALQSDPSPEMTVEFDNVVVYGPQPISATD